MEAFHCIVKFTEECALLSLSRKLDAVSILGMMVFMSHIEENLEREGTLPFFYRRYVGDTLAIMPKMKQYEYVTHIKQ